MSLIIVKPGEAIALFAKLGRNVNDKYVRAYLKDANGADYTTPYVNLTNRGLGLYTDNTILFNGGLPLIASYRVFNDSGYSEEADNYDDADIIMSFDFGEVIRKDSFTAVLVSDRLVGVMPSNKLTGEMYSEYIEGVMKDKNKITGVATPNQFIAEVRTC